MENKAAEELIALQYKLHKEWLNHPITAEARKVLKSRFDYYKLQLQEGILSTSNEKAEQGLRNAMTTCQAIEHIIFDPVKFTETLNKINK